jgi:hypothetical protein
MDLPKVSRTWKIFIIPEVCLFLSGCGSLFPNVSATPLTSTSKLIHSNTQAIILCEFGNLELGTSNYEGREFIDEFGNKKTEATAGLWVSIEDQPETRQFYRAYGGLSIFYYSYRIQVLRIGADLQAGFTEVEVTNGKQAGSSGSLVLVANETVKYNGALGILNVLTDDYVDHYFDDARNLIEGPAPMIKLWIEDQLAFKTQRIVMGQTILFKGYRIHITRIDIGRDGWFTMADVGLE